MEAIECEGEGEFPSGGATDCWWRDDRVVSAETWSRGSETRITSWGPPFSESELTESAAFDSSKFSVSAEGLGETSNASSKLSAALDALFSSSESTGDVYELPLPCNLESSFTSPKTESCFSSHKAASSLLSTHSTPLKSSWTLEKASIGNPPFSSPFKIVVGAFGGEMLSTSPNKTCKLEFHFIRHMRNRKEREKKLLLVKSNWSFRLSRSEKQTMSENKRKLLKDLIWLNFVINLSFHPFI